MAEVLTPMRRKILEYIVACQRERNFPPTIREIAAHVGLNAPATVANHIEVLKRAGYIEKNLTVRLDLEDQPVAHSAEVVHLPFVGDVAAGTGVLASETVDEVLAIPAGFAGKGDCFVLRVRGESMIDAGILPGDFVVVERREVATRGEIVVAEIPGEEATVKRFFPQGSRVILKPENSTMEPLDFSADEVRIYGRVVSVLRNY